MGASSSRIGTADGPLPSARVAPGAGIGIGDRLFALSLRGAAWIVVLLAVTLVAALVWESKEAIGRFGLAFLYHSHWDPVTGKFGALPFVYGTIVSSILALLIAVPLSLGAAIFLAELAPGWIRPPIAFLIEMLAAVPSVVYGLWGIFVLVPWLRDWVQPVLGGWLGFLPLFQGPPYGIGMLAAGVILAIMVVPYITSVSREVLLAVPGSQREAALGIGATRWETTRIAVLRYGRSGLVGAILLGLGRALGETMAVTMVIGNRPEVSLSLFAPGYTMASVIANEFTEATSELYVAALVEIGLLLLLVTIGVNGLARLLVWSVGGPTRGERE
jgi:phosphate transport system permease protein